MPIQRGADAAAADEVNHGGIQLHYVVSSNCYRCSHCLLLRSLTMLKWVFFFFGHCFREGGNSLNTSQRRCCNETAKRGRGTQTTKTTRHAAGAPSIRSALLQPPKFSRRLLPRGSLVMQRYSGYPRGSCHVGSFSLSHQTLSFSTSIF